ncbi:MFS transporter [Mycobacterium lehmannii]|uniref:MFS transporter n=1 Tax=Mycobacterium lehmannii TaxID=2048550 RepID=UPI000A9903A5|nr:MFS transporter [Mycobacterium lehmannii]
MSVSVLTNAYQSRKASHAIGLAYGIAALGNAAGPLIGGLFTATIGWRWIFWLNLPLTLVSLANRRVRAGAHQHGNRIVPLDL